MLENIGNCKDDVQDSVQDSVQEGINPTELDYIPLFMDFYDRYSGLSYEERGRLAWAMLAYARGEDPALHLTGELARFCFPNEREVIDRTAKVHVERRERLKAASKLGIAARKKANHMVTDGNHMVTDGNHVVTDGNHNNNYNNNYNNNNNNNHNNNIKGGTNSVHGANRRSAAGKPTPVGREKIL